MQRFERRLEGLVNGAFAKAFKSEVQPVELASALQRECDDRAAIVSRDRTMVPNEFAVELGGHDHDRLAVYAEALGRELSDMVTEYAQEQGYSFIGPVTVAFDRVDDLETGMFRIRSRALAGVVPMSGPQGGYPGGGSGRTGAPWLEINGVRHPLRRPAMSLGRGTDVDLRIDDPSVSRRHAEIRSGPNTVIVDLGSTNGIVVDGVHVQQAHLHDGSTIVLGSTTIVYRQGEG
jgi:hypothetical protein